MPRSKQRGGRDRCASSRLLAGGGADGVGAHRNPAPIAATDFPASQALGRGAAGRAVPRGVLGVLPQRRARRRGWSWCAGWWNSSIRRTPSSPATMSASPTSAPPAVAAAQDYFRRVMPREWDRIRRLHAADEAVEAEIRALLGGRRSVPCLISAPAPDAFSSCSGRRSNAVSASISITTCSPSHAAARPRRHQELQRAARRHLRSRGAAGLLRRRDHPPGVALPRRRRAARSARRSGCCDPRTAGCW